MLMKIISHPGHGNHKIQFRTEEAFQMRSEMFSRSKKKSSYSFNLFYKSVECFYYSSLYYIYFDKTKMMHLTSFFLPAEQLYQSVSFRLSSPEVFPILF